jgi:hypothetical protein
MAVLAWDATIAFNAALARFQAAVLPIPELSLQTVLEAARPAFLDGFCYVIRQDLDSVEVCLRHVGGAEVISSADSAALVSPAILLAGLLGIPVDPDALTSEPDQHAEEPVEVQIEPIATCASEPDLIGPDSPADRLGDHDSLQPLTDEQVAGAVSMVKAMDAAQRKSFTIAFRHAFSIPENVLRITAEFKQQQHLDFIDRFTLEAAGGVSP